MRRSILLLGLLGLVASGGVGAAAAAGPHARPAHTATNSIVVRPVTSAGQAAAGFNVKKEHDEIDCKFAGPSPGAVDKDIDECSPSAAYAIACWKSSKAHHALCTRDPRKARLYRIPLMSSFEKNAALEAKRRAPLLIVLTGGAVCSIRDGGAWGTLKSHPKWSGSYSCTKHGVVWASPHSKHYGIDESAASWTVQTGSAAGSGKLTARHIATAYFVGTA